ncbi:MULTISPECIES: hypothetical protein [Paenibacillus]|uniref:hypothetical protein n=1 Tax=Paenibacillus TaxID=44249 RepID=UPI000A8A1856|nr:MULTISPECIES: hypothetical protein [Paenibacillus]GIP24231.1 hypothetical protein J22TS3_45060 [Paenibacillus sp. J22TS3]
MHLIFQRHHIPPDEVYNKEEGVKRFMYASMLLQLEEEEKAQKREERLAARRRGG